MFSGANVLHAPVSHRRARCIAPSLPASLSDPGFALKARPVKPSLRLAWQQRGMRARGPIESADKNNNAAAT
jgi:hypothetical protein